jgi:hypothetical protein
MSKFLAPIHTMMFNKIKLQENLEKNLLSAFKEAYGEEVSALSEVLESKFGAALENKPLEELIDTSNIHGWLQSKISSAETRQAALITEMIKRYGNTALEIAETEYILHAKKASGDAAAAYILDTPEDLFAALNKYILEGMPCDNVNSIKAKTDDLLQWQTARCLHKNYWDEAGGDVSVFYRLRSLWIQTFVKNAKPDYSYDYDVHETEFAGERGFIHQITKK